MPNPFAKTRPASAPYAIYSAGDMVWHVCKTYQTPQKEAQNQYARWFVWAKSPFTFGSFEGGDTYRSEVINYGRLVAAEPEWQDAHNTRKLPTPAEYMAQA